jgi:hypothetical protein
VREGGSEREIERQSDREKECVCVRERASPETREDAG